jgi:hypothetical protein
MLSSSGTKLLLLMLCRVELAVVYPLKVRNDYEPGSSKF